MISQASVIDSHTAGEPTRVVISGAPDLGPGSMAERLSVFRNKHDTFRSAVISEPRGSDILVGALLCEPVDKSCAAGVLFFNNVGYLGMCGHGAIGLVATLAYLKRITAGVHRIETPVGIVTARLHESGQVSVQNVPSYRHAKDVAVEIPSYGEVRGDVAWGGNWFFLANVNEEISLQNLERLTDLGWRIRQALARAGVKGRDGGEIDHIEFFGRPRSAGADSRNFVLCPGKAYDRSPCGTGTSAKLACLYADGKLRPGQVWRQESIIGSIFEGSIELFGSDIIPTITGTAYITGNSTLLFDSNDPFKSGIRA